MSFIRSCNPNFLFFFRNNYISLECTSCSLSSLSTPSQLQVSGGIKRSSFSIEESSRMPLAQLAICHSPELYKTRSRCVSDKSIFFFLSGTSLDWHSCYGRINVADAKKFSDFHFSELLLSPSILSSYNRTDRSPSVIPFQSSKFLPFR